MSVSRVVTATPSIRSECPERYFVAAWIATSTPWPIALKKSGEAQVLSITTFAPRAWAAAAIAGMSCTSKVSEHGDSTYTTRVFGRMSCAMPAPTSGS